MYEINEGEPFYFSLKVLIWSIAYPPKFDRKSMIRFFILGFILKCMMVLLVVCCILHFIMLKKENIDWDFSENFAVVVGGGSTIILNTGFALLSENFSKFLCDITKFTVFGKPTGFEKSLNTINRASRIIFYLSFLALGVYGLSGYIGIEECIKKREISGVNVICRAVLPTWWPYPVSKTTEWLIFTLQLITIAFAVFSGLQIFFLIWQMTYMVVMHFEVLKLTFPKIITDQDRRRRSYLLKLWLMYHIHVLKLSRHLNKLVKKSVGIFSLAAALIVGCTAGMLSNSHKPLVALVDVIGSVASLFFLFDAGQRLQDAVSFGEVFFKGISVYDAMCDTPWYNVDIKTKKDILFMMMSSSIDVSLSALPIGTVNYPLLLMILKGAYSYFSLIQNTK